MDIVGSWGNVLGTGVDPLYTSAHSIFIATALVKEFLPTSIDITHPLVHHTEVITLDWLLNW